MLNRSLVAVPSVVALIPPKCILAGCVEKGTKGCLYMVSFLRNLDVGGGPLILLRHSQIAVRIVGLDFVLVPYSSFYYRL